MITHRTLRVGPEHAGERLDVFVAGVIPTTSRPLVQRAIEKRWLMVDGQWRKKGGQLAEGNTVTIERLLEDAE